MCSTTSIRMEHLLEQPNDQTNKDTNKNIFER